MEKTINENIVPEVEVLSLEESKIISANIHFQRLVDSINKAGHEIASNFFVIGEALSVIQTNEYYKISGFDDIYSFAEKVFGFKQTSVKNYIAVYDRFNIKKADFDEDKYSFTQLVELLPVPDADLKEYKPYMKIKEIRTKKVINSCSTAKKSALKFMTEVLPSSVLSLFPDFELVSDYLPSTERKYGGMTNETLIFKSKYLSKWDEYFIRVVYDPNEDGLFKLSACAGNLYSERFDVLEDFMKFFSKNSESYKSLCRYVKNKVKDFSDNEKLKKAKKDSVSLKEKEEIKKQRAAMTLKNNNLRSDFVRNIENWVSLNPVVLDGLMQIRKLNVDYSKLKNIDQDEVIINISLPYSGDRENSHLGDNYYKYNPVKKNIEFYSFIEIINELSASFY